MITIIKLNYTIDSPEERNELVKQILEESTPNEQYLEILADYLVLCMEKKEKKERKVLTDNRMATVNKRETSFEGLADQFENGEDGIYNLVANDKHIIFQPKVSITKKDLEEIPPLRELRNGIERWEQFQKKADGRQAFIIKHALIEMRKDQYLIKNFYRCPIIPTKLTRSTGHPIQLDSEEWMEDQTIKFSGVSLLDYHVISTILCNYCKLKCNSEGKFKNDTWYLMQDFDKLFKESIQDYPMYRRIVEYKIDLVPNTEIRTLLEEEFGFTYSLEYISSLWRNKIPKLIASAAMDDWLLWYYTEIEKGNWKKCSRCGQIKLANPRFFSSNKTSKDGFYSICKKCRNKRGR